MADQRRDRDPRKLYRASDVRLRPNRLDVAPSAFVAPGAVLVGEVSVAEDASIWYGCVLRGDLEPIRVGRASNVQDLTAVHVDRDLPTLIGDGVTIGHRCVIHGCVVEDDSLIGMGAVLLSGSRIGEGALVAAGAVVLEGFHVPPGMVAAGVPARVLGRAGEEHRARIRQGVEDYLACCRGYREGSLGGGPFGGPAETTRGGGGA